MAFISSNFIPMFGVGLISRLCCYTINPNEYSRELVVFQMPAPAALISTRPRYFYVAVRLIIFGPFDLALIHSRSNGTPLEGYGCRSCTNGCSPSGFSSGNDEQNLYIRYCYRTGSILQLTETHPQHKEACASSTTPFQTHKDENRQHYEQP